MGHSSDDLKRLAAERAAAFLDGIHVLGLGTGSTAAKFVEVVAEMRDADALGDIVAVPTSVETETLARQRGIPLGDLESHPRIDVTVDGADEVSPDLDLVKGLGGALTREKIVASVSRELIIIVDDSKLVGELGETAPLAVEVVPFGWNAVALQLADLGCQPRLRRTGDDPFVTDQGNFIVDCGFAGSIGAPQEVGQRIDAIAGVVAHGLFLGMADRVVVAGQRGVRILERTSSG